MVIFFHSFNLYKKFVLICWVEFVWLRLINNKQESVSSLRLRMTFSTLMRFTQLSALLYCQTCHYFSGSCRDNVGNWASCFHQCTTVLPNNIDSSCNSLDESAILYPPNLAKNFDNCSPCVDPWKHWPSLNLFISCTACICQDPRWPRLKYGECQSYPVLVWQSRREISRCDPSVRTPAVLAV